MYNIVSMENNYCFKCGACCNKIAVDFSKRIIYRDGIQTLTKEFEAMLIPTDMETGTAAKMHTVGVLWGFRDREELESNGAEKVAEKPQDLLYICEEWKND